MTLGAGPRPRGAGRAQLHETALRLFARDGVDGTSLQTIADEMGVSKAAVYYHYKTKDELVLGVLAPLMEGVSAISAAVGARRGRQARLEALVTGLIDLAVDNHDQFAVIFGDPYVGLLFKQQALARDWTDLIELFTEPEPEVDQAARVALSMLVAGLLGPLRDPALIALGPQVLREHMTECGRRLLQIRRRQGATAPLPR